MSAVPKAFDPAQSGYKSSYLDAAGIRTHYLEAGKGQPLVLVHGGGPGADGYGNWYSCLPIFSRGFRALAVDMLGFGHTDKPDPASFVYSQDARTKHMIAFIEALGAGPVTLIGNSMGGLTSLCVAIQRPDLVSKLILMGSAGIKSQLPPALQPLLNYDGTRDGMRRVIGTLTHSSYSMDEALLDYRVEMANRLDTMQALQATMGWVKQQHGLYIDEDEIRKNRVPTLVVGGKSDPIVTPVQIFRFLELIDNSWGYLIPHCGHWVMMERPEEFCALCTRFIHQ
jgi:2-hydroxy-6-oxo-6-(2'-aminophenyl)hexa-2,4-dienoate hydrolase